MNRHAPASIPNDFTVGANGHYTDLPGYDEVTGLGAPDLAKLDARLR